MGWKARENETEGEGGGGTKTIKGGSLDLTLLIKASQTTVSQSYLLRLRVVLQTLQARALYANFLFETHLEIVKLSHVLKNLGSVEIRERERLLTIGQLSYTMMQKPINRH